MRLQPKLLLIFFSLAFLLGTPLLWTVKGAVHRILLQDVERRGLLNASDLAKGAALGFEARSEPILLPQLQYAQERTGAVYAVALSPSGDVLAHSNVSEKGKKYDDAVTLDAVRAATAVTRLSDLKGSPFMHVSVPVWLAPKTNVAEQFLLGGDQEFPQRTRLGTVSLGLPLKDVLQTEYRIFQKVVAILLIADGIGLLVILILMRRMLRPIRFLSEGTSRISRGEYGINVPVLSKDEFGHLANDFNHMSKVLAETTVSKDFLGGILSHMIDPLIVMTMKGTIQMVNKATLDLLGYSKEELEGQPAHILFMSKQQSSTGAEQETLIIKGSVRNLELEFLKKSGGRVSVLFSSSVMKNLEDQPTGVIAVAKDVTERKRLESIIRHSDKMSAVGQLAAGVAHEINNPLGVILGFAQAALRRITPGDTLEMPLKSIEKEAVRCKNLVQDLLTFSRVAKVEREPMDLNKTIEGALSLVTARARTVQVEVRKELAADLPRLLGNPNQIQQVIVNLANNAFDAMGEQGGILTVKTESLKETPLSWICLRVTDTGSGISPEVLPRVFEPFLKASHT